MNIIRDWSIKSKISTVVLLTCCITVFLAFVLFIIYENKIVYKQMVIDIMTQAEIAGSNCMSAIEYEDEISANETLTKLSADKNIITARLYVDGDVLFASYEREDQKYFPKQAEVIFQEAMHLYRSNYLQVFQPIVSEQEHIGVIELIYDLNPLRSRIRNQIISAFAMLIGSLFVGFLLSTRMIRLICQPIDHLSLIAGDILTERNYSLRAQKHGNDELGGFISVFNEMLDQIQERDCALLSAQDKLEQRVKERTIELYQSNEELKQANDQLLELDKMKSSFVSQASHDLRTPLTAIKGSLDNLMRCVGGSLNEKQ